MRDDARPLRVIQARTEEEMEKQQAEAFFEMPVFCTIHSLLTD